MKTIHRRAAMSDRMKAKFSTYVPCQRLPGEAMPLEINTYATPGNEYRPAPMQSVRAGADMHFQFRSRGV